MVWVPGTTTAAPTTAARTAKPSGKIISANVWQDGVLLGPKSSITIGAEAEKAAKVAAKKAGADAGKRAGSHAGSIAGAIAGLAPGARAGDKAGEEVGAKIGANSKTRMD